MIKNIQLIINLMKDQRVHLLVKILPFLSLIYLLYPDFIPGPIDDGVVIALFLRIFLALVPDEYIEEHRFNLENKDTPSSSDDAIIEGEFWEE
jgi:uncharacterized membrane protein YkvA (DUF1232 family)